MTKSIVVEIDGLEPGDLISQLKVAASKIPPAHAESARVATTPESISFIWEEPVNPKMALTEHFDLLEFIKSTTAIRNNINNIPTEDVVTALTALCDFILEPLRRHFNKPIRINSGYRSPTLNALVNGSKSSQHLKGEAADIEIDGVANSEIYDWIKSNLSFDQLILEFHDPKDPYSGWVHVSWKSKLKNRKQALEIK